MSGSDRILNAPVQQQCDGLTAHNSHTAGKKEMLVLFCKTIYQVQEKCQKKDVQNLTIDF